MKRKIFGQLRRRRTGKEKENNIWRRIRKTIFGEGKSDVGQMD